MTAVTIIRLDPTRWQESKALRLEALQQDPTAFGSDYEEEKESDDARWEQRALDGYNGNGNITLYAEDNGKLVGMMGTVWTNRIKTGHIATIYGVYITPTMRGKGVGTLLMQAMLDEIRKIPQIEKVTLTVSETQLAAKALYEKFGFKSIGITRKELKIGDTYYDEALMERFL